MRRPGALGNGWKRRLAEASDVQTGVHGTDARARVENVTFGARYSCDVPRYAR